MQVMLSKEVTWNRWEELATNIKCLGQETIAGPFGDSGKSNQRVPIVERYNLRV